MTLRTVTFDDADWQVVPKNPVPEMIESGARETIAPLATARAVYIAMLAAAPEPPAQPRRPYGTDTMSEYGVIPECDGPKPPAQEPMTVAETKDQSSYWHHWYMKSHEELEAVRQGWIRVVDEFLVTRHLGIASPTDTYDEARAKLLKIINFEIDIATDPVVGGDRVRKGESNEG